MCVYFYHRIKVISKIARGEDWSKSLSNYTSDANQSNFSPKICILQVQSWVPFRSPQRSHSCQTPSFPWMNSADNLCANAHEAFKCERSPSYGEREEEIKNHLEVINKRTPRSQTHTQEILWSDIVSLIAFNVASRFYYNSQLINELCRQLIINSAEIVRPLRVQFCSIRIDKFVRPFFGCC